MSVILYDLAGADRSVRFSPFCWIAKFALLHKGIDFETEALGFLPKSDYPDPEYGKLPMLAIDGTLVRDSGAIVEWLEDKHPQSPLVHDSAKVERVKEIAMGGLMGGMFGLSILHIVNAIAPEDKDYFRTSREERFGMSLEDIAANPDARANLESALAKLESELGSNSWFGGQSPDLGDYYVASILMWRHSVTQKKEYDVPASIAAWFERMKGHFNGYAAAAPTAAA